ncbi:MAG TPA: DUF402 domain-containing protein [Candidatus Bathyarchaeota archaeon]|nr:DUF402 domain-containing protein [Candidatus Bathyarchaeota archaeon]
MRKVRIRGIYATALTKLLLDKGFVVVQPSLVIAERFKMVPIEEEPDVVISDRQDKHGVVLIGRSEHVDEVLDAIRSELYDAIIRRAPFEIWAVYKGLVVDYGRRVIDIGSARGFLASDEEIGPDEEEVLVQIVRVDGGRPVLSRFPSLRGDFATLRPLEPGIEVSGKVLDARRAKELIELAAKILPEGMGLKWRSTSARVGDEELVRDVEELLATWEGILRRFEEASGPVKLAPGKAIVDVEFPLRAKGRLDELRSSVCPTLEGHHAFKTCGGELATSVEMAEKLLFQGMPREQVRSLFTEVLKQRMPIAGSRLGLLHVKLDGTLLKLGEAEVLRADEGLRQMLLLRTIRGRGFYDGLGVRKEPGDLALSRTGLGSMRLTTSYLAPDGTYKGTYVNINTPVEVCPGHVRYVDLEVDVCLWPDGTYKVLDEELLMEAVEEGVVSKRLAEEAMSEVDEVLKDIEEGEIGPPKPEEMRLLGLEGEGG